MTSTEHQPAEQQPGRRQFQYSLCTLMKAVLAVSLGLGIGIFMTRSALDRMQPPRINEYNQLCDEIYRRYLTDGALPAPDALSTSAQRILSEHEEIQYTTSDGLSCRYDKAYPVNVPLVVICCLTVQALAVSKVLVERSRR